MIGAAGFLASLMEFIITRLIGRKIELAFDHKRQAALAFLDLFESLRLLEQTLIDLEQQLEEVVSGRSNRLFGAPMERVVKGLQDGTNSFTSSLRKLKLVIDIFDQELGDVLYGIAVMKGRTFGLLDLYKQVELKLVWGNTDYVFALEICEPDEIAASNSSGLFDQVYLRTLSFLKKGRENRNGLIAMIEMATPVMMVRTAASVLPVKRREIASNDREQLKTLMGEVHDHLSSLSTSRRGLAELIKSQFSLDDLLRQ